MKYIFDIYLYTPSQYLCIYATATCEKLFVFQESIKKDFQQLVATKHIYERNRQPSPNSFLRHDLR